MFELRARPEAVADAALRPRAWLASMPHVLVLERIATGDAHGLGDRYFTKVRAVAPYVLTWEMQVVEASAAAIGWVATGDLEGVGRWELRGHRDLTEVRSTWSVRPAASWMTLLWPLAAAVFVRNHDIVMRRGAQHLASHLDAELVSYTAG